MSLWGRAARVAALIALTVLILISSSWLASRVIGSVSSETELGEISYSVRPSFDGELTAYVPITDWGFRVDPIWAPISLSAELRAVNRDTLLHLASGDSAALSDTKAELQEAATHLILEWLALTLLISVISGSVIALIFRAPASREITSGSPWLESVRERAGRAHYLPLASVGISILASAALLLHITLSFNEHAFDNPSYFARGAELKQLLDSLSSERDSYVSSLDEVLAVSGRFLSDSSSVSSAGGSESGGSRPARSLILASDFHGNAVATKTLRGFTNGSPVILAGDYGQTGSAGEASLMAPLLSGLSEKVLAVSGNHDSTVMMQALRDAGIRDLEGERTARALGMRVAGWADPMKWRGADPNDPTRIYSFAELDDSEEREEAAQRELLQWWDGLSVKPELVMIHQNGLAQSLARELAERVSQGAEPERVLGESGRLTILTGHDHRQHIDRYLKSRLTVVDAGTAGASGPYGIGRDSVGLARLSFLSNGELQSVDLLRVEPVSGNAQVDRVRVSELCPGEPARELCEFAPPVQDLGAER